MRKWLFGLPLGRLRRDYSFAEYSGETRDHLRAILENYVHGYHSALLSDDVKQLQRRLLRLDGEVRGYAFEGAGTGLTVIDTLMPWRGSLLDAFVHEPGLAHLQSVLIGVGWGMARLRRHNLASMRKRLNATYGWFIDDGYAFHNAFFDWTKIPHRRPGGQDGFAARVADQGVGRGMWFKFGTSGKRIRQVIDACEPERHPDLWTGVGVAAAYAGGVGPEVLSALHHEAGAFRGDVALGIAMAARARHIGNIPTEHTDQACRLFCGMSARRAAELCEQCFAKSNPNKQSEIYQVWQQNIRAHLRPTGNGPDIEVSTPASAVLPPP